MRLACMTTSPENVTQLLKEWRSGDPQAFDRLLPLVYEELRSIAHRYIRRENAGHSLQTTALVHEAYLRLVGRDETDWQNRSHFFGVCAQVMRHLLVDRARARHAAKRGGSALRVSFNSGIPAADERDEMLLALDAALDRLSAVDERKSRIVELRYFGGLSVEETAEAMNLSTVTIKREWQRAKAFLFSENDPS